MPVFIRMQTTETTYVTGDQLDTINEMMCGIKEKAGAWYPTMEDLNRYIDLRKVKLNDALFLVWCNGTTTARITDENKRAKKFTAEYLWRAFTIIDDEIQEDPEE